MKSLPLSQAVVNNAVYLRLIQLYGLQSALMFSHVIFTNWYVE